MTKNLESYEEMFDRFVKEKLSIRMSFNHEYGYGNAKRAEVSLILDGGVISSDSIAITEGAYESSW